MTWALLVKIFLALAGGYALGEALVDYTERKDEPGFARTAPMRSRPLHRRERSITYPSRRAIASNSGGHRTYRTWA